MHVLVIGYGNPLRGDDAFGWHVAKKIGIPDCQVLTCHQLTPELAEDLSHADVAIFIDATIEPRAERLTCRSLSASQPVRAKENSPRREPWESITATGEPLQGAKENSPRREPWVPITAPTQPLEGAKENSPRREPWVPITTTTEPLEGAKDLVQAFTHHVGIDALLSLARELYGHSPAAYVISAVGEAFDCGETLSPAVAAVLDSAVNLVAQLIADFRRPLPTLS